MFLSLNAEDLARLRLSVGYGSHKKGRPLSPVEVGRLLEKALESGMTLRDCANAIQLNGTGHIRRFLRILNLPNDLLHLVDWGSGNNFIGFSAAFEMTKLNCEEDQRVVAKAIITERLTSKEVAQISQLSKRSGRSIIHCINEAIGMRPTIERRFILVGSVESQDTRTLLMLTQGQRDLLINSGLEEMGVHMVSGRLGSEFFTLVGGEEFNAHLLSDGADWIETTLRTYISEALNHG